MTESTLPLLTLQDLTITLNHVPLVEQVHFSVSAGEILVIVGESGSGKTTLLKACAGLLESGMEVSSGEIAFSGQKLKKPADWNPLRGQQLAFLFQNSLASFCPVLSIKKQLWDAARKTGMDYESFLQTADNRARVLDLPPESLRAYPQELSGGMIQRAGLLFPLINPPRLLLADEPTSSVDSVTQKKMADALLRLRRHHKTAIILVTHDIRLAAYLADSLLILQHGRVQEYGPARQVLTYPASQYTQKLLYLAGMRKEG